MSHAITIARVADARVLQIFHQFAAENEVVHISLDTVVGGDGQIEVATYPEGQWSKVLDLHSDVVKRVYFRLNSGDVVSYYRGKRTGDSAYFDELDFNYDSSTWSLEQRLIFFDRFASNFESVDARSVINGKAIDANAEVLAFHQSTWERLQQLTENLIKDTSAHRKEIDEEFSRRNSQREEELTHHRDELSSDWAQRDLKLQERENEIALAKKAIDDSDNTTARRKIRERMLDDVKARLGEFGVSLSTKRMRVPVLIGILSLGLAFALLLTVTFKDIGYLHAKSENMAQMLGKVAVQSADDAIKASFVADAGTRRTELYFLWFKSTLLSFGLIGTILYYIKWQNKWAAHHADSEFQLQQFYIDVNRANWVMESCLEWSKSTNTPIPKTMISSFTNGLFVRQDTKSEETIHPADALASALLGTASSVRLHSGDSELTFNNPGKSLGKSKPIQANVIKPADKADQ